MDERVDQRPFSVAWRNFKRMQGSACVFASLVYALAVLRAWNTLDGEPGFKGMVFLLFPAAFFGLAFLVPLIAGPLRRTLKRYVLMSFASGFGQSVISVLVGLGVLAVAAGFIFAQIAAAQDGGRYPAGIFSAYASGIGILFAQLVLAQLLERDEDVRELLG